jgi:monovalent cation:proton antiporter-2 (CPA2) family protein
VSETPYLVDVLAVLAAAVIAVWLSHRVGLGSILGYLAAGSVLGPWGLGVIERVAEIRPLAELGVVFLLFVIGIEMKPARLWVMRRLVFGLGLAQVFVTGTVLTGLVFFLESSLKAALVIGFGLALSSTAFGLQLLSEKGELISVVGRISFSVLLLQDLAVVPLLAMVSLLSEGMPVGASLGAATAEAIIVIGAMVFGGRFLLNPILDRIAASRNSELFVAAAVLLVLGVAWLMEKVGMSMALGAFLAGLMLAESDYRHQIEADIQPFRGLLLGLFFMSVGMTIDFGLLSAYWRTLIGLVVALMLLKATLVWLVCRPFGITGGNAVRVALLLSQGGEFGFVLFGFAMDSQLILESAVHLLILVVALSMAATPLVVSLGDSLVRRTQQRAGAPVPAIDLPRETSAPHVILAGFGRVGHRVATLMHNAGIPFIALDNNQARVAEGRFAGFPVFFGDASRFDVLKAAGAAHASMLVVALDNPQQAERLLATIRQHYPSIPIHIRARDREHCESLHAHGASTTVSETLEASLRLGELVLVGSGLPVGKAARIVDDYRQGYYGRLKGAGRRRPEPPAGGASPS